MLSLDAFLCSHHDCSDVGIYLIELFLSLLLSLLSLIMLYSFFILSLILKLFIFTFNFLFYFLIACRLLDCTFLVNGDNGFDSSLLSIPSREMQMQKPLWCEVVNSLNAVDPHAFMNGNSLSVTKLKSILSDLLMWDGPSIDFPCFQKSWSNSLHALHPFAITPDEDENDSLPSMVSIIS